MSAIIWRIPWKRKDSGRDGGSPESDEKG